MIDIVFPNKNEETFIKLAERLSHEGLLFVYTNTKQIPTDFPKKNLIIKTGVLCEPKDVQKHKNRYTTLVKAPSDHSKIRGIIEQHKPHILFDLELSHRTDFMHHRASGLNHIMSNLANEKNVSIGFNFSNLLTTKNSQIIIGRMQQNLMFANKYKFPIAIASFTNNPWLMRSKKDIISFFSTISNKRLKKENIGWNK